MRDSRFDDILKNKLNGLTSDKQPDWASFAQEKRIADEAMRGPDAEDIAFDAQIFSELDAYEAPSTPDWAAFLDKKTLSDNNLEFDNKLKQELEQHTTSSQPQWGAFVDFKNKRGDTPQEPEGGEALLPPSPLKGESSHADDFDAVVRATLEEHQPASAPQWAAFLDKKQKSDTDHQIDGKHRDFDGEVRAAVAGLVVTSAPDWGAFSDLKNDLGFDSEVRESLEDHTITSEPQWEQFLDGRGELGFDSEVRETVEGHSTTSEPQWDKFLGDRADLTFDSDLRGELEGHTTTGQPQWDKFLGDRSDLAFDSDLRGELEGHTTTGQPQWEKFLDDRNDLGFDSEVRDTIEDHTSNSEPQWEKFLERKRRDDEIAPAGFDQGVSGTLGRMKVRYNSEHWLLLRARLQRIAELRKAIFSYKGLEMLFVSLMLFTMANHLSPIMDKLIKEDTTAIPMAESKVAQNELLTDAVTTQTNTNEAPASSEDISDRSSNAVAETNNAADAQSTTANTAIAQSAAPNPNNRNTIPPSVGSGSGQQGASPAGNNSIVATDIKDASTVGDVTNKADRLSLNSKGETSSGAVDKDNAELAARALMAKVDILPDGLDLINKIRVLKETQKVDPIDYTVKKTYKDDGNWLHLFAAMESDLIRTPFADDIGLPGRTENTFGYAFEGLYSVARGPWEYEAGLGYNFFKYTPHTVYRRNAAGEPSGPTYQSEDGMNSIAFDKISLNMVSIPLKAKYHFIMNGRWSVFGSVGINNDFLAVAKYDITDEIQIPNQVPPPPTPTITPEYPILYTDRAFTQGFLNRDPLSFNNEEFPVQTRSNFYFLRGTIGAGAERNISDYVAAYVRADYHETLVNREFGPFNDRINKWSFGMGFKFRVNR